MSTNHRPVPDAHLHLAGDTHVDVDVAVVGGGLAGLVAAITAARHRPRPRVAIFEPHDLGGRARVDNRDGFTFGRGSRALYRSGEALPVLRSLGVDVTAGGSPNYATARYRTRKGMAILPQGAGSLLRNTHMTLAEKAGFLALLARVLRAEPDRHAGQSFGVLLRRWRGKGMAEALVHAVARTTSYLADFEDADAAVVLRQIQRGLSPGVIYLDGGWGPMVATLVAAGRAAGVVRYPTPVKALTGEGPHWAIATGGGPVRAGTVVIAAGSPAAAAGLLGEPVPGTDRLGPPVTQACLELGLRRSPRHPLILGVGEPLYLSQLAPPAAMAPDGMALLQVGRYHAEDDDMPAGEQHRWLWEAAQQAGVDEDDVVARRFLARMTVMTARPRASTGGLAGRPAVAQSHRRGLFLAGDWVGPVGVLSDAAVASGADAGRRAATMAAGTAMLEVP